LSTQPQTTGTFHRDSTGKILLTIENFYRFCAQRKLMGVKCRKCGRIFALPRNKCYKCNSTDMEWNELKGTGTLLSYSIVHVATSEFQKLVPYAVGILQMDEGTRLSGMIRNVRHEDLEIGMNLVVDFEENTSEEWPQWPRFFFRSP